MQSIKEKKLLVKFAKSMGQPIDPAILEEVQNYDSTNSEIYLVVATNLGSQNTNVGVGMQWREIY